MLLSITARSTKTNAPRLFVRNSLNQMRGCMDRQNSIPQQSSGIHSTHFSSVAAPLDGSDKARENELLYSAADNGVVTLTLNRVAQRNALDTKLMKELRDVLLTIKENESKAMRVVVICAKGNVFCSGHDLKEMAAMREFATQQTHAHSTESYNNNSSNSNNNISNKDAISDMFAVCSEVMTLVSTLPQPVIASVNGMATGAGCQLVAACDLAVAGPNARFCTPGVTLGLFCSTPAVALARCVGRKAAMDMLLTGRVIDADEAQSIGLVSHLTKAGDDGHGTTEGTNQIAQKLAESVAQRSGSAVALGKTTFNQQIEMPIDRAYECASAAMRQGMLSPDFGIGARSFLNKSQDVPTWTHEE